jgi:cytochrome P450/NADPH-cytochrome P450 reductase
MDRLVPARSWLLLSKQYGEIYQLKLLGQLSPRSPLLCDQKPTHHAFAGRTVIMVNNYWLAREVLYETRFHKAVAGALKEIRILVGDGLFTAYQDEPNWAIARQYSLISSPLCSHHRCSIDRVLMPAFGPANIKGMFDDMFDIATQLVFKWERFGSEHRIDPTDDFTRLALDTIALCSMHYRINSFYSVSQSKCSLSPIFLNLPKARNAPFCSSHGRFLGRSTSSRQPTPTRQCNYERGHGKVL